MYSIVAVPSEIHNRRDDFAGSLDKPSEGATPIAADASGNLSIQGTIERPSDVDAFRFGWSGGPVSVSCNTNSFSTFDSFIRVYDAAGTLVGRARSRRAQRGLCAVQMNLPAGEYAVVVAGRDDVGDVGMYRLDVKSIVAELPPPLPASPDLKLEAAADKLGPVLSWNALHGVESYVVENSSDAVNFQPVATTEELTWQASLEPGAIGIYRVRAQAVDGPASTPLLVEGPVRRARNLHAFGNSPSSIILEWRDGDGETGYLLERAGDGEPFTSLATVSPNSCGFRDTHVQPGSRYRYRVTTLGASSPAPASRVVAAMAGVADLAAAAQENGQVVLSWKAAHPGARLFVERAVGGPDSFVTIGALAGGANTFIDRTAIVAEDPRYRIVAVEDVSDLVESKTAEIDFVRLPHGLHDEDFYALRFTGKLDVKKRGRFNFYLTSDDGSRLFLDGSLVVNNDERHVEQTVCGTIDLEVGQHELEVQYFQHDGSEKLELSWAGAGVPYSQVTPANLSSLVYRYYKGTWWRLPFDRLCAVSDVVNVMPSPAVNPPLN
jgi:hypothetical protein